LKGCLKLSVGEVVAGTRLDGVSKRAGPVATANGRFIS
jgi:hypothetical protein